MVERRLARVSGAGVEEAVDLLRDWNAQNDASSPAAAYANVLWSNLVHNLFINDPQVASESAKGEDRFKRITLKRRK